MLKLHMGTHEDNLISMSKIQNNTGHNIHKGTPREVFIKEFLESHLPENIAIGTGEIIDCNSRAKESRNQHDIVLYKKNFPKLDFKGGINGFLIESVVATIEVKSFLSKNEMESSINAARNAKLLERNLTGGISSGFIPPKIINYVVAYDGPSSMETVLGWIDQIHNVSNITIDQLPIDNFLRQQISSPSIDGVFILKKGFLYFDNLPITFTSDEQKKKYTNKWFGSNVETGSLLMLFCLLQCVTANISNANVDIVKYLSSFQLNEYCVA